MTTRDDDFLNDDFLNPFTGTIFPMVESSDSADTEATDPPIGLLPAPDKTTVVLSPTASPSSFAMPISVPPPPTAFPSSFLVPMPVSIPEPEVFEPIQSEPVEKSTRSSFSNGALSRFVIFGGIITWILYECVRRAKRKMDCDRNQNENANDDNADYDIRVPDEAVVVLDEGDNAWTNYTTDYPSTNLTPYVTNESSNLTPYVTNESSNESSSESSSESSNDSSNEDDNDNDDVEMVRNSTGVMPTIVE